MTVDEAREFAADTVEAAVAKAAGHFGVPAQRLEVRRLGDAVQVSGLGSRALILAAVSEEQAPLGPVGEFVGKMARELAPEGEIRVEESESDGQTLLRLRGEGVARVVRGSPGVGAALSHLAQRAAQELVGPDASARVELAAGAPRAAGSRGAGGRAGGRPRPRRSEESGRDDDLVRRAREVAEEVRSTGQPQTMGRMTSRERFIVHNAIREVEGVTSESIGDPEDKRVKVMREE